MTEHLHALIARCAREVAEQQEMPVTSDLGPETRLFGREGLFDSIGLVSLIVTVEQAIEEEFEAFVTLADERAMSQKRSPFLTIGSLADYAERLIREAA